MSSRSKSRSRLFIDAPLDRPELALSEEQGHYLSRVLRLRPGDSLVVFNARGSEREATIESLAKRHPVLALGATLAAVAESPAALVLLQALVKSDAMDLIVQKATELGVGALHAFSTDFAVVHLDGERREHRLTHWRRIAASACEQSGRHRPPELALFDSLDAAVAALPAGISRIAFDPGATRPLGPELFAKVRAGVDGHGPAGASASPSASASAGADIGNAYRGAALALGPEGGFTRDEVRYLESAGFAIASLGPRILRAETAAIAACSIAEFLVGDLGR